MTPKNVKPLLGYTKSHFKFQPNMICSFGAIVASKSDDDAADYGDDDPYMSPSYGGDTKMAHRSGTLRYLGPQNYTAVQQHLSQCIFTSVPTFSPIEDPRVQILCHMENLIDLSKI